MRSIALIDDALTKFIAEGTIPGLVAAAADRTGVVYEFAFGRRDASRPLPMSADCVFRIASMTKAITGAAAMQMVEQEKLSLDQPARRDPAVPGRNKGIGWVRRQWQPGPARPARRNHPAAAADLHRGLRLRHLE